MALRAWWAGLHSLLLILYIISTIFVFIFRLNKMLRSTRRTRTLLTSAVWSRIWKTKFARRWTKYISAKRRTLSTALGRCSRWPRAANSRLWNRISPRLCRGDTTSLITDVTRFTRSTIEMSNWILWKADDSFIIYIIFFQVLLFTFFFIIITEVLTNRLLLSVLRIVKLSSNVLRFSSNS